MSEMWQIQYVIHFVTCSLRCDRYHLRDVVDPLCHHFRKVQCEVGQIQFVTHVRFIKHDDVRDGVDPVCDPSRIDQKLRIKYQSISVKHCVSDDDDVHYSDVVPADYDGDYDDIMCIMSIITEL